VLRLPWQGEAEGPPLHPPKEYASSALRSLELERSAGASWRQAAAALVYGHQVRVDAQGVAPEADLRLNPLAARLARRRAQKPVAGWGNLTAHRSEPVGHPAGEFASATAYADRLAIAPGAPRSRADRCRFKQLDGDA